jgi:hypothetical protein
MQLLALFLALQLAPALLTTPLVGSISAAASAYQPAPTSVLDAYSMYVSDALGDDGNDGLAPDRAGSSRRGPFKTLPRALEALERLPAIPAHLFIRAGTYHLLSPLLLTRSNVSLSNFGDDALPLLTGARPVGPWQRSHQQPETWVAQWAGAANFSRLFTRNGDELANCSRVPIDARRSFSWAAPLEPCTQPPGGGRPVCPDANRMGFRYNPADLPSALLDAQPTSTLRVRVESSPFEETVHTVAHINRSTHVLLFGEPDAFALG